MIRVTRVESYEECGHMDNGCSGRETVEFIGEDPERDIIVKASESSCYGINEDDLLTKFTRKVLAAYGIKD